MIPNKYLTKLLQINFHSSDTFSESKIKLVRCEKLILSTNNINVINGAFGKLTSLFLTKNKFLKRSCIPIFKKVKNKISSIDIDILDMLSDPDDDVVKLALKFVKIFSKFYSEDCFVVYNVLRSKTRYKFKVIKSILSKSNTFLEYFTQSPQSIVSKYCKESNVFMEYSNISSLKDFNHLNLPISKINSDRSIKRTKTSEIDLFDLKRKKMITFLLDKRDVVQNLSIYNIEAYNNELKNVSFLEVSYDKDTSKSLHTFVYALKCLYQNKVEECINIFSTFVNTENLDYKFKVIFNYFIKRLKKEEEPKQLLFDIKGCHIDESLIIRINGYNESPVYKKILMVYKNLMRK